MYLLCLTTNGKHYIQLTEDYSIQAFKTVEEVVAVFKGFEDFYERGKALERGKDSQWSGSATIAMCNLAPKAIKVDFEASKLEKYILDMHPIQIWGGNIGRGYLGVEVSTEFRDLPSVNIWSIILDKVYK